MKTILIAALSFPLLLASCVTAPSVSSASSHVDRTWKKVATATRRAHHDLAKESTTSTRHLREVFDSDSPATRAAVLATLGKMATAAETKSIPIILEADGGEMAKNLHSDSSLMAIAFTRRFSDGKTEIHLSAEALRTYPTKATWILTHELSHAAAGMKDHGYLQANGTYTAPAVVYDPVSGRKTTPTVPQDPLQFRLENADTITAFISHYF